MNKAFLIGRLTRDPEVTKTQNGIDVCRFTLAINRVGAKEETDFIPVVVWRNQAVNCGKYLAKGKQCCVVGSIQTRSYEDKQGAKRYVTEVIADNVEFLSKAEAQESIDDLQPIEAPADDGKLPF